MYTISYWWSHMEGNHRQISSQMIKLIFHPEMDIKPLCHKNQWALSTFERILWSRFLGLSIHSLKVTFLFICKTLQACLNEPLYAKTIPKELHFCVIFIVSSFKENVKRDVLWPPLLKKTLVFDILIAILSSSYSSDWCSFVSRKQLLITKLHRRPAWGSLNGFTVSLRSTVFQHKQDSVSTRGLYRHNTMSLLVHYRQKIWNIFHFSDFLYFVACVRYLYIWFTFL